MKHIHVIILILLSSLSACKKSNPTDQVSDTTQFVLRPQHNTPWPSLASTPWPMARQNPQATGRSLYPGPTNGRVKTIIPIGTEITDPAIGADSVFYLVSDTCLYAITYSGNIQWRVAITGNGNENPPILASNGLIYVGTERGVMSAYHHDGTLAWKTALNGSIFMKSCGIGLDGTIYAACGGILYALDASGNIKWQKNAPMGMFNYSSDITISFAPDGSVFYVPGTTSIQSLYVISPDGSIVRTDSLGGMVSGAISVDVDGNVFVFAGHDLVSVSPSGLIRWRIKDVGSNWDLTIDPNGNIAYISNGYLYSVDNTGQRRWRVPVDNGDWHTHLVCDALGTIYAETSPGGSPPLYNINAVSSTGSVLWKLSVSAYIKVGGPSLTGNGYLLLPQSGLEPDVPKQMYVIE